MNCEMSARYYKETMLYVYTTNGDRLLCDPNFYGTRTGYSDT